MRKLAIGLAIFMGLNLVGLTVGAISKMSYAQESPAPTPEPAPKPDPS